MTAPDPLWHPRGLTMFDVGRIAQRDDEPIQPKIAHVMGNLIQAAAGGCLKGACKVCPCRTPMYFGSNEFLKMSIDNTESSRSQSRSRRHNTRMSLIVGTGN